MLDHTDKRILEELAKDGRISMKKLGEKVHLTGQAAANRVVKLEEDRVIEGYTVRLNYKKTGYAVHAFVTVFTKNPDHRPFLAFVETQRHFVAHAFKIGGEGCYLMECRFPSNEELDGLLNELTRYANYKLSMVISEV